MGEKSERDTDRQTETGRQKKKEIDERERDGRTLTETERASLLLIIHSSNAYEGAVCRTFVGATADTF